MGHKMYSFHSVLLFWTVQLSITFSNRYLCKVYVCLCNYKKAVLENSVFIKENYLWGMYKTVKNLKKKKKKHIQFAQ